jgi:CheY-like chemotaxis protein
VLDALGRQHYDVVLMDVQMPELDGLAATRRIRREFSSIRRPYIIAMTANAMQGDRELCLAAGMDDYISKPVRREELLAALERCPIRPNGEAVVPAAAETDLLTVIDQQVLRRLQDELGGGDPAIVVELIDMFLADMPNQLIAMQQAYEQRDAIALRRSSHTAKSSAAIIGALDVVSSCQSLETDAANQQFDGVTHHLAVIEQCATNAIRALQMIRTSFNLEA